MDGILIRGFCHQKFSIPAPFALAHQTGRGRRNMKGWIGGLAVGMVLGSALATVAQGQWQSGEGILGRPDLFRLGYTQGMYDMLAAAVTTQDVGEAKAVLDFWRERATCLDAHTQARGVEFLRWADGVWQSKVDKGSGIRTPQVS
jgi:hypothetical protein